MFYVSKNADVLILCVETDPQCGGIAISLAT